MFKTLLLRFLKKIQMNRRNEIYDIKYLKNLLKTMLQN